MTQVSDSEAETADTQFNGKNDVGSTDSSDSDFNNGLTKTDVVISGGVKLTLPYARPSAPSTTNLVDLGASEAACASAISGANCAAGGTLGTCALASGKCSIVYTVSGMIPLINAGGKNGFYNVGTFTVNSNITMTIPAYDGTNGGRFYVLADAINLNGPAGVTNIDGSVKGYRGGAGGGADAGGSSSPDIKTSSYGRAGGIGGGSGAPATQYAAYGND